MPQKIFVPLDTLVAKPIAWLWRGYIPFGAISILEGDPGTGKSSLARDLIARVTAGFPMPSETDSMPAGGAILLQSEDSQAAVVGGMKAMGADLSRVLVLDSDRPESGFRLPDDLPLLEAQAAQCSARLLAIDPLSAFTSALSSSEGRARECFDRLAHFAEHTGMAVVVVRHFRKGDAGRAIHRGIGSVGAVAVARSVLAVADCSEKHRHVLVQTKTNLCSAAPALEYRTVQRGEVVAIEWLGPSEKSVEELFGSIAADSTAREDAAKVLYSVLEDGPVAARDVYKTAAAAGISKRTLDRAKRDLKVRSRKSGSGRKSRWYWQLPDTSDAVKAVQERVHDELCDQLFHGDVPLDDPAPPEKGSRPDDNDGENYLPAIDD